MKRAHLYLSQEQQQKIDAAAQRSGSTKSEVIRRSLDSYLLDAGNIYLANGDVDAFVVEKLLCDVGLSRKDASTAARTLFELVRNRRLSEMHS